MRPPSCTHNAWPPSSATTHASLTAAVSFATSTNSFGASSGQNLSLSGGSSHFSHRFPTTSSIPLCASRFASVRHTSTVAPNDGQATSVAPKGMPVKVRMAMASFPSNALCSVVGSETLQPLLTKTTPAEANAWAIRTWATTGSSPEAGATWDNARLSNHVCV